MTQQAMDERLGKDVAQQLKDLGVRGILISAAEQGRIPAAECQMGTCLCPEELGGKSFFEPVPDELPDWMPTADHIELKSEGGKLTLENVALAHRLCNRARFSIDERGGPGAKDTARAEAARDARPRMQRAEILRSVEKLWNQDAGSLGHLLHNLAAGDSLSDLDDGELHKRIRGALR